MSCPLWNTAEHENWIIFQFHHLWLLLNEQCSCIVDDTKFFILLRNSWTKKLLYATNLTLALWIKRKLRITSPISFGCHWHLIEWTKSCNYANIGIVYYFYCNRCTIAIYFGGSCTLSICKYAECMNLIVMKSSPSSFLCKILWMCTNLYGTADCWNDAFAKFDMMFCFAGKYCVRVLRAKATGKLSDWERKRIYILH